MRATPFGGPPGGFRRLPQDDGELGQPQERSPPLFRGRIGSADDALETRLRGVRPSAGDLALGLDRLEPGRQR